MSLNQNQRVLNHLITHGYITQTIASNYGIRRLASRINDLKKQNVLIQSNIRKDDAGVPYAYYTLVNPAAEANRLTMGMAYRAGSSPGSLQAAA
jgi:hypothetical protein